jgi:hypothetical protein
MLLDLRKKDANVKSIAKKALKDDDLLSELVENLKSQEETVRYNSYKVLLEITQKKPEALYPSWDFLEGMLDAKNTYWRSSSARLLGNLMAVDSKNKFEKIFDRYYDLLNDSVIIAAGITANSGRIAKAKPKLQSKITNKLLNIDKTDQKHKDLIKAGAIESFDEYFEDAKDKKKILKFVKEQLDCESPKTRKKAKEFLIKWEKSSF